MKAEEILLEALNIFGNFTIVTQEFNENQLDVIYKAMELKSIELESQGIIKTFDEYWKEHATGEFLSKEGVKILCDDMNKNLVEDKNRLDALQKLGGNYGVWILRESGTNRGLRLYESTKEGNEISIRRAIDRGLSELNTQKNLASKD